MTSFTIIALVFVFGSVTITSGVRQTDPTSPKSSEETTQRLPERNADWETIRANNLLYIDKTPYLMKLLQRPGKLWYVTRPRRFGKSLFINMAEDYFRGKKNMFKGLAVENVGNTQFLAKYMPKTRGRLPKWKEFPVIHLNFGQIKNFKTEEEFENEYQTLLIRLAVSHQLDHTIWPSFGFSALVEALRQKFNGLPIIVLIDEYDHPFQYAFLELKNKNVAKAVRITLNNIFTVIKNNVDYLGLALVTGVWKLGLVSLESTGTNAFVDLTFDKDLAEAFGLSETEITSNMGPNLRNWVRKTEEKAEKPSRSSVEKIMEDLKVWYDGYQFAAVNESCRVFNPISTIQSVKNLECENYWMSTGSLAHLIDQFYREKKSWDIFKKGLSISRDELFIKIDPLRSPPPLHIWMLMFGYYTISDYDERSKQVTLSFPNKEIEESLEYNIAMYIPSQGKFIHEDLRSELSHLRDSMLIGNTKGAMEVLKSFVFFSYKSHLKANPYGEMAVRLMLIFRLANVKFEDSILFHRDDDTSKDGGDIDIQTVNLPVNYIFEIKCTKNEKDNALSVIKQPIGYLKHHPNNFINANKKMSNYKIVAMNFLFQDRSILLNSWIALPCVNGIVQYSDVIAYPENLKSRFVENILPEYENLTCGPVV